MAAVGAGGGDCLGDAEVGDGGAAGGEEDVVRFDVAVDDAARVRVGERPGHVTQDADHLASGKRPALEPLAQAVAVHVGHAEPRQARGLAGAENRHDVRMLELGCEQHFTMKPLEGDAGQQLRREHLHDDSAVERLLQGKIGAGHAAAAQLALERIRSRQCLLQPDAQLVHSCLCSWNGRNMPVSAGVSQYELGAGS